MGQNFSTNRLMPDIKVIMTKYFQKYQIIKILNNGMLSKTLLILNGKDPNPLILKCFLKNDYKEEDRKIHRMEFEKLNQLKNIISSTINYNIAPMIALVDDYRVGMIFRQYVKYDLKERMYLLPYLRKLKHGL